ncbi:hypothetical protein DBR42_06195 [Pelomonas sp. HMWF004]|nr:hypothetical protein DBR42_06195 [Pelomonas sp. HMWF004]
MNTDDRYAPPKAAVQDVTSHHDAAPPPLWNPGAAASWSLLFSPIFGALLHRKNWLALGDEQKAAQSKAWAIGSGAFYAVLLLVNVLLPDSKVQDAFGRSAGLALLVAWYYAIGKSQSGLVLARYGKNYPRKGWLKPLGIAVGVYVAFLLAAVLVGVVWGTVNGAG